MLTVRYPNGTTVDFNNGHNVEGGPAGGLYLVNKKGNWIAYLPSAADVVVYFDHPCAVHDGTAEAIKRIANDPDRLRELDYSTLEQLKRALRDFNMQTGRWK